MTGVRSRSGTRYRTRPRLVHRHVWLPECNSIRRGRVRRNEPQIWLRILHVAGDGASDPSETGYREQVVEVVLGPKGVRGRDVLGTVTRQVAANQVVTAAPPRAPKPPMEPRTPRVADLLRRAIEWRALLESGQVRSQAEIARRDGITRARVTQIMGMLRLDPGIQQHILAMPDLVRQPAISERALRPIAQLEDPRQQLAEFRSLSLAAAS